MIDPRLYQIATLGSLLVYGMGWLDFGVTPARVCLVLLTVVATQTVCDRWNGASVNVKSALISGLSLCLLLRTNRTELAILAAVISWANRASSVSSSILAQAFASDKVIGSLVGAVTRTSERID